MASTHFLRTFIAAATSNAAGATTTGTAFDLTTKYGGLVTVKLTNGGTGPTIAPTAKIMVSGDNSAFKLFYSLSGDTTASTVNEFAIDLPPATMYARVDVTGNTGQAITCEAFLHELTSI